MASKPVVVVGSINMDLVCRVTRMPGEGETVSGSDLLTIPGGKGANQAVAAARVATKGDEVHLIGRVGEDDFGGRLLVALREHGGKADRVTVTEGVSTGCAVILVDKKGENSIVVSPGANTKVGVEDVDAAADLIGEAAVVLLQLEIPVETVAHTINLARQAGVRVILDPTPVPAKGLSRALYGVDVLTPNQTEAEALLMQGNGLGRMKRTRRVDAKLLGEELRERGPGAVVLKLGRKGAMLLDGEIAHVKGHPVSVVDTTAAGDAFNGALAVGLAEGMEMERAVRFANAAGAEAGGEVGAQPGVRGRVGGGALL